MKTKNIKKLFAILFAVALIALMTAALVACDPDDGNKHTLTFESAYSGPIASVKAEEGSDISAKLPAAPASDEYYFEGWTTQNNGVDSIIEELPSTMPAEDVTYYAVWSRHYTIVPKLQDIDKQSGELLTTYTESPTSARTYKADPESASVNFSGKVPTVVGFRDSSPAADHSKTLSGKDSTFYINYDRNYYTIGFSGALSIVDGSMEEVEGYFGQTVKLPEFGFENVPVYLRFAGWSESVDGGAVAPDGAEVEIGGALIGGNTTSVTLYAQYDVAYVDFTSGGNDLVFIPSLENGVAIVRRVTELTVLDMVGTYTPNPQYAGGASFIGAFKVNNDAGTVLEGRVYDDGHFAYRKNSLDMSFVRHSVEGVDLWTGDVLEGTSIIFNDDFGSATLTLGETFSFYALTDYNGRVTVDLEAGVYNGGYWTDVVNSDMCFTIMREAGGETVKLDIHFNMFDVQDKNDGMVYTRFGMRGKEAGIYCEGVQGNDLVGDILMADGYGNVVLYGDESWDGMYTIVNDGDILLGVTNSANDYREMLIRYDAMDVFAVNGILQLPIIMYERGDSSIVVRCENEDGSAFDADGFGGGSYTDAQGNVVTGEVTLVGDLLDSVSSSFVYELKYGSETLTFLVDHNTQTGEFIVIEGRVSMGYLYNTTANDYVGAIVTLPGGNEAYFLIKVSSASGGTVFAAPSKGTVTAAGGATVFNDGDYIISYESSDDLTQENGVSTYVTSQVGLNELTVAVKDETGAAAGTFTIDATSKATYVDASGETVFEDENCQYLYAALKVDGQDGLFIVNASGDSPVLLHASAHTLYMADVKTSEGELDPIGILYTFFDGVMYWSYGENDTLGFYGFATQSLDANGVYSITFGASYMFYAIKQGDNDYLAQNSSLRSGVYEDEQGNELTLDRFGRAQYKTANGNAYSGTYGIVDGTYELVLDGEGAPSFRFMVSGAYVFEQVNYGEFLLVDAASLLVSNIIRISYDPMSASLYRAYGSGLDVERGSLVSTGTVRTTDENTFEYVVNSEVKFRFYFDETILTTKAVFKSSDSLAEGTFDGENGQTLTLDKLGRATYRDESGKETSGFYYVSGGAFRMRNVAEQLDLHFTLDTEKNAFASFDPDKGPVAASSFDIEYNGQSYELSIDYDTLQVTIYKDGDRVVSGKATQSDGVYTFMAADNSFNLIFIISGSELIQYDPSLDFKYDILSGNIYLYEAGFGALDEMPVVMKVGELIVDGFLESARIENVSGATYRGKIERTTFAAGLEGYLFTAADGSTQELIERTLQTDGHPEIYLAAYGFEKGDAYDVFITSNWRSSDPVIAFDGLGKTGDGSYYVFGPDPFANFTDASGEDDMYIITGTFENDKFEIADVYKTYDLSTRNFDGTIESVLGVVKYDADDDAVVVADDGSIFVMNGFDEIEYLDSIGVAHMGYYNNYGYMNDGNKDNSYVIVDESENTVMYFIDTKHKDSDGIARAKRLSYNIFFDDPTLAAAVYAEVQLVSKEYYTEYTGEPFPAPGEKYGDTDGYGVVLIYLNGSSTPDRYPGYYTLEEGYLVITVETTGGDKDIQIMLYVEGFAEWLNANEWFVH